MKKILLNAQFLLFFVIYSVHLSNCQYSKEECFDIPDTLCAFNKGLIISSLNKDPSLLVHYTFDEIIPKDSSGNSNDPIGEIGVGPSAMVKGNSAYFNGTQMLTIPHKENFEQKGDLSVSFWIYLLEDSTGNWRTILQKGENIQELTPTIMLWPNERRLHVRAGSESVWNDGLESKGLLNLRQWTHIALVISGQMMQLFINGNLDSQTILKGKVLFNKGDFHIGKDAWHSGVKCYIDEFKIYGKALAKKFIEAEASIGAPLLSNVYVKLGCEECSFVQALTSCEEGYHMCSYDELYAGAYLVARRNGWFQFKTDLWTRQTEAELDKSAALNEIGDPKIKKMTLCCNNN
ncbi:MAG: LamG domain-containing protein [archaeon]|nr:LamG domain-containing protein [archaeon]